MKYIKESNRIYLEENDDILAEIRFKKINDNTYDIYYTYVDKSLCGNGVAYTLVKMAVDYIKDKNCNITATCKYANNWLCKFNNK